MGHVAGPGLEEFLDDFEHGDHGGHIAVRSEVSAPFAVDISGLEDARIGFVGDTDTGIGLAVFQQHIVARLVFLDQTVFQAAGHLPLYSPPYR